MFKKFKELPKTEYIKIYETRLEFQVEAPNTKMKDKVLEAAKDSKLAESEFTLPKGVKIDQIPNLLHIENYFGQ